ncbi:hypothetical protein MRX96_017157 [Rhipicephalus microplus]
MGGCAGKTGSVVASVTVETTKQRQGQGPGTPSVVGCWPGRCEWNGSEAPGRPLLAPVAGGGAAGGTVEELTSSCGAEEAETSELVVAETARATVSRAVACSACACVQKERDTATLRQVFQRIRDNGLQRNKAKCRFREKEVQFLGQEIDATGLHPLRDILEALTVTPRPESEDSTLRQIREWIKQGWPSRLTGQQQHLQPYFTRRHKLVDSYSLVYWGHRVVAPEAAHLRLSRVTNHQLNCCWDSSPRQGCPPTFLQGQCLQRLRLPENDLFRSQRHPFSHPESPPGPANFNKGRHGFQGQ